MDFMKILHTSDWHIGRLLYGRKRYDEFSSFLDWLAELIKIQGIDAVLISGDVFDTSTPSNRAQELYYRFLCTICTSGCRHVVIIAGNHDSPSFLNAPKNLLQALNVHVVGSITGDPDDEVILLRGKSGEAEAIVCAVPYLRDRDIRVVAAGESIEDKGLKLAEGIQRHYAEVCEVARNKQDTYGPVPVIGMGHLFTAGGKTLDGDGVRELYVGSLAHVGRDIFPDVLDYVALGHLHVPQKVGKSGHIRYAGSPVPMGYGEARQEKSVVIVDVSVDSLDIRLEPVPRFQVLERISGGLDEIVQKIEDLTSQQSTAWLEIEYTGKKIARDLRGRVHAAVEGSGMEIRRIKNQRLVEQVIRQTCEEEVLDGLETSDVFERLLDAGNVAAEDRPALLAAHQEIVTFLDEEDTNAE